MRLHLGTTRVTLIVAPHPDDEVIGAAALIALLRKRGTRIRVVVVTDGAASHPNSRRWPRARLVAARRRESRRALRRLGMRAGAVAFLDLPDGTLSGIAASCQLSLRRAVARTRGLDLIVGPVPDDAHPDHRAVADALARCRVPARRLGYRVWPPGRRGGGQMRTLTFPGGAAAKRSLIRTYRSQLGAIRDDPTGFAIARHELDRFAHPLEYYAELRR